jgi:hypothetical protein
LAGGRRKESKWGREEDVAAPAPPPGLSRRRQGKPRGPTARSRARNRKRAQRMRT